MAASWHYTPPDPVKKAQHAQPPIAIVEAGPSALDLGSYQRTLVTNVESASTFASNGANQGRVYFDLGLRLMFAYHHEEAAKFFAACVSVSPDCALAHGMIALCHGPNYNFKGDAYFDSTDHPEQLYLDEIRASADPAQIAALDEMMSLFPSQQVATKHAALAVAKVEELRRRHKSDKPGGSGKAAGRRKRASTDTAPQNRSNDAPMQVDGDDSPSSSLSSSANSGQPAMISDVETHILSAIKTMTSHPGVDPALAEQIVGRPYADAMRKVYKIHENDAEVAYFLAESLMVLNAWSLYEYPTGRPLTPDVFEIRAVLEKSLQIHPTHAGLCHMYVHLMEMSSDPGKALPACEPLRKRCPDGGHLVHMATHIDVLVGDYDSCVRWNEKAIEADQKAIQLSPDTAGTISFYFGYIVHNYHMLVYGCILGGMEGKAMEIANKLNGYLSEELFINNPDLTAYLESYAALDIHVLVRFGRWRDILRLAPPQNPHVMLYRSASLRYARALAFAFYKDFASAKAEANLFDMHRRDPSAEERILHNNTVADLLAVDDPMVRGEIAYHEGRFDEAFQLLRRAVALQDGLNYDEPWGKMQPIRHALGGLLLERGHVDEAEEVFRADLKFHPKNPWSLTGLLECLDRKLKGVSSGGCCHAEGTGGGAVAEDSMMVDDVPVEMKELKVLLSEQRKSEWADFEIKKACACVKIPRKKKPKA